MGIFDFFKGNKKEKGNSAEDGYYINADEEYIEYYELIYEHWLNGVLGGGEGSIIHNLAQNWLEENDW